MAAAFVVSPTALSSRTSAFTAAACTTCVARPLPRAPSRRRATERRVAPRAAATPEPGAGTDEGNGSGSGSAGGAPRRPRKPEQTFFGLRLRTNGDVLKFGVVATAIPFAIKTAIQATGVPDLKAGQITTAFVSVFALVAWVSSYVFRVGTKNMTYAQQLREYEDQVIQKRYEELTDDELNALQEELKEDE